MKKVLSLALASLTLASTLASCAPAKARLDSAISLASSDAAECAAWLDNRLEDFPTDVIVGIGSNEVYGIDMSDFDEDGYVLRSIGNDTLVFGASAEGLDRAVRAYAKAADAGSAAQLDETYHEGARIKRLTIAGRDISEYIVVYNFDREVKNPGTNSPTFGNAKYAAEELVRLVEKATGITLTAVPHTESVNTPVISIDYYTGDDLGENGFTYEVKDGNVYINGVGVANGCANAVYYLLEHECGWDALLYGDSDLQPADLVDIPNGVSKKVKPMFNWYWMRHMYFDDFDTDKSQFSHSYRGSVNKASHGITQWMPEGFDDRQCFTDEYNYLDAFEKIYDYVAARVDAGDIIGEDLNTIDIGIADNHRYCSCKTCMKVYKEEGSAHSGAIIRFANRLSEEMSEDYPGINYTLYAYAWTKKPCKTAPNKDIRVTFCTDGICANHILDGSECTEEYITTAFGTEPNNNSFYVDCIKGWGELTDNLYVFHYQLQANFAQYTQFYNLYDDLHFLYDMNVSGFTPEADYTGLGLGRLRFQLMMDILWHPEMTEEEYNLRVDEHMRREYGDGYEFVKSHIELWRSTEVNTGCWLNWFFAFLILPHRWGVETYDIDLYSSLAPRMYEMLEEAMKGCSTAKQESRVRRLMCDVLYKECSNQYFAAYDAEDNEMLAYLEERYDLFVEHFSYCGYDFSLEEPPQSSYAFGPGAYCATMENRVLQDDLTDAAWIDWLPWREYLTEEGTTPRPAPEKYGISEG